MDILKKIFGTKNARDLKRIKPIVAEINRIEAEYQAKNLADEDFPRMTAEFKRRVAEGETLDHILPEAFALVKDACRHLVGTTEEVCGHVLTWDMVPFDCQLVGGIVLHFLIREDDRVICGVEKLRHAADAGLLSQRMDNASPLLDRRLRR